MWSSAAASTRHVNCGLPPEFFFVAPASSFQHHHQEAAAAAATTINFDPHSINASNAIGVGVGVGVIPLLTATPCVTQPSIAGVLRRMKTCSTTPAAALAAGGCSCGNTSRDRILTT
ncbi:UNVERIFIED_CONTAM: hypothetical protein Sradi_1259300 [Sesamum radiatum]|uniref:Uncharacterized protein n=1 Tax=Sesamum radiatum TaxID=300843 RepID=A0AAW2UPG4_SESRA